MDTAIALAASALVLLALSNLYPLVTLELNGSVRTATLMRAVWDMYLQGYAPVAGLLLLTTVLIPLFQISALLYVLVSLRTHRIMRGRDELFRALTRLRPWAMSEVFMLGAMVAVVKLSAMATVIPGIALFSYGALMLVLTALINIAAPEHFWRWMEAQRP